MSEQLLYDAWALIANAGEGDWNRETPEWRKAAERWRDKWHNTLTVTGAPPFVGSCVDLGEVPGANTLDAPRWPSRSPSTESETPA